jgi:DNA processing protein
MTDFVINRLTIISGFMYGIDTEAHRVCLDLGGKTVAVLGSGLDCLPTIENDNLYSKILESGGAVLSEYEPNFKATVWSFPQRNRIVAGLATTGVLVVEAGIKSGSLITARIARDQNRTVFAVPGPITSSTSEGNNWLLKNNWARLVTEPADILGSQLLKVTQTELFDGSLSVGEKRIIESLKSEEMTMDEGMLMKDLIKEEGGKIFLG